MLKMVEGPERGQLLPITRTKVKIGRSQDNDIVLSEGSVSSHQAEIELRDGNMVLRDVSTYHSTKVNGSRETERHLSNGDRVQLGDETVFIFEWSGQQV